MKKILWQAPLIVTCVLLILILVYVRPPPDPSYQGMRLSAALEGLRSPRLLKDVKFHHPDLQRLLAADKRGPGADVIRHLGTNTFPRLEWMLQASDSTWRAKCIQWLGRRGFLRRFPPSKLNPSSPRHKAMVGYLILGEPAIPSLVRASQDHRPAVREAARQLLFEIAPQKLNEVEATTPQK